MSVYLNECWSLEFYLSFFLRYLNIGRDYFILLLGVGKVLCIFSDPSCISPRTDLLLGIVTIAVIINDTVGLRGKWTLSFETNMWYSPWSMWALPTAASSLCQQAPSLLMDAPSPPLCSHRAGGPFWAPCKPQSDHGNQHYGLWFCHLSCFCCLPSSSPYPQAIHDGTS